MWWKDPRFLVGRSFQGFLPRLIILLFAFLCWLVKVLLLDTYHYMGWASYPMDSLLFWSEPIIPQPEPMRWSPFFTERHSLVPWVWRFYRRFYSLSGPSFLYISKVNLREYLIDLLNWFSVANYSLRESLLSCGDL